MLLRGDVGAPAPDGHDQSFGAQRFDGLADGAAGDAVFSHELALGRQRITRPVLTRLDSAAEYASELDMQRHRVKMVHAIISHMPYRN